MSGLTPCFGTRGRAVGKGVIVTSMTPVQTERACFYFPRISAVVKGFASNMAVLIRGSRGGSRGRSRGGRCGGLDPAPNFINGEKASFVCVQMCTFWYLTVIQITLHCAPPFSLSEILDPSMVREGGINNQPQTSILNLFQLTSIQYLLFQHDMETILLSRQVTYLDYIHPFRTDKDEGIEGLKQR